MKGGMQLGGARVQVESLEGRRMMSAALSNVAAGDVNGDGKADLVVLGDKSVRIALGNGDGTFTPTVHLGLTLNYTKVEIADVNGDGSADLVTSRVVQNGGQTHGIIGVLVALQSAVFGSQGYFQRISHDVSLPAGATEAVVGDWNGDGKDNIGFVNEKRGFISALYRDLVGSSKTLSAGLVATTFGRGVHVSVGDIDGDGIADVVGLDRSGNTHVAFGVFSQNAISFENPIVFDADGMANVKTDRVLLGEADHVEGQEIFSFAGGNMYVSKLMEEEGIFFVKATDVTNLLPAVQRRAMIADVNGDGIGDLLALVHGTALYDPAGGAFFDL
jgi:hypothetical protein